MTHFLQSEPWEVFQKKVGRKVMRTQKGVLVVMYPLPLSMRYAYAGGAPFEKAVFEEVKAIAAEEQAIFLKWESMAQNQDEIALLTNAGFKPAQKSLQPQQTSCVDLQKDEEALLAAMHHKTRYNIGLAERKNVSVQFYPQPSAKEKEMFLRALRETASRDKFHLHEKEYYEALCDVQGVEIACARVNGEVAAAHLLLFFADKAIYLHGGSVYAHRASMAPYFLHWESMREAKKRGCAWYDFWGIDEKKWPGLTRFKEGFGGEKVSYVGSWDYPIAHPQYALYQLRQRMRK